MPFLLTGNTDEYWSWYAWGHLQDWVIGEGQEARDRCHWAMSICINLRPEEAAAWISRGWKGGKDKETGYQAALADITKGSKLATVPGLRALAYYARAYVLAESGQMDKALGELNKAIGLLPDKAELWVTRYEWQSKLGPPEPDEALADMRRVLDLFPEPEGINEYLVRIWAFEATELWAQVLRESVAGHAADLHSNVWPGGVYPHLGRACLNLGRDYLASGKFDKALEGYEQSERIGIEATVAEVLVVGPDVRDPEIALPYALHAVKAKPDWPYYHRTLGIVYYRLGRYEKAIESLQKAVELHWDEPAWESFFMAMAQWQLRNKNQARDLYYRGVEQMARANLNDYFTNLLLPYRYEAATLLGIPGAPTPKPDLVYREEDE